MESGFSARAMTGWRKCWITSTATLKITMDYFAKRIPKIKVIKPQGTYLLWLDWPQFGYG